jgi:alkyl sulfatase BDS1-like metallo-beta-lactamase superfamily hydrolase
MATDDRAVQPLAKPVERSPEAPTTEAGRELHLAIAKNERLSLNGQRMREYHNAILAIEAEARAASERGPQERPPIDVLREVEDVIMSEPWWPRAGAIRRRAVMEKIRARLSRSVASPEPSE